MSVLQTLVNQAPCLLWYKTNEDSGIDENGNPYTGGEQWSEDIPCDAVPAGRANERMFDDGVKRSYSHTIYLKADCPDFFFGQTIKLKYNTSESATYHKVLGFHRYQLQAKLWV